MLFLCYSGCSTCRKARKWLDEKGVSYQVRDIREQRPTEAELRAWAERGGLDVRKLFNTSGQQYRALDLKNRLPAMTGDEMFALLATDCMLVKRPILVTEKTALSGFREEAWEEAIK